MYVESLSMRHKKVLEHKWSEVHVSENIAERISIITFISSNINFPNNVHMGESNGKLPPRTFPGCSVPEPYRSHDWALVPAKPGLQG